MRGQSLALAALALCAGAGARGFAPAWEADPAAGVWEEAQGAARSNAPAAPAIPAAGPARHNPRALQTLLERISRIGDAGARPVVVFDIDDTLINTGGRHLRILREFIAQSDIRRDFSTQIARLDRLGLAQMGYSLSETARAAGVDDPRFIALLDRFWADRFFSNDYLVEDPATPGAADYLRQVVRRGGVVVYLTGRWPAMREGTIANFRRNGFPLPDDRTVFLFMKPDRKQSDADFKDRKMRDVARMGTIAGGFENEPRNINIFRARSPRDAVMIFLDTKTSGAIDPGTGRPYEPDPGVSWVRDFNLPP